MGSVGQSRATGVKLEPAQHDAATADGKTSALDVKVPHAAADILKLAAEMNGLDVASAKPWHVKISFDQFDEDGDNVHSGTLEEFHVGPKKYKRIYTSDTLNQTDIANGSGLYRSGDQRWPSRIEIMVLNAALHPLDLVHWDERSHRPEKFESKSGSRKFPCVFLRRIDPLSFVSPVFCFDPGTMMLRQVQTGFGEETVYNNIVLFQGRFVAKDIEVARSGKSFLKIHVEELGEITKASDSLFSPPPDSTALLGGRIVVSGAVLDEYIISRETLVYPRTPAGAPIGEGKVNVKFVVGKNGRVIQAEAVDGPAELRPAAVKATLGNVFRPFLILDQPVEVESSESFEFHR